MAFGIFYPRFKASRKYHNNAGDLREIVKAALTELEWPFKIEWGKDFVAEVPWNAFSYRHEFKVAVSELGEIDAQSKSMDREMFLDFGRNKRRVVKFFAKVYEVAGRRA